MKIPEEHVAALLEFFQSDHGGLAVDGRYGPKTAKALDDYLAEQIPVEQVDQMAFEFPPESTMRVVFESALKDVGQKEEPLGSNMGPYVEGLRKESGLLKKGGGEWCAVFLSTHFLRHGIDVRHRGAPGIVRLLAKQGSFVAEADIVPGFYGLSLHRRGASSHHVRIFLVFQGLGQSKWVQFIGGNERHEVVSKIMTLHNYLKDVLKVSTI